MAIQLADIDFAGPPPTVQVRVGFAQLASYTIAIVPPNFDLTGSLPFVVADEPAEVDAIHSLAPVWSQLQPGWFIVAFGGVGAVTDPPTFDVSATFEQAGQAVPMTVSLTEGSSAASFVAAVELA